MFTAIRQLLNQSQQFCIAYSGGIDSQVLLHQLAQLKKSSNIHYRAVHVNHHIHPQANDWQQHCEQTCQALAVPLTCLSIHLTNPHRNVEAQARELRYQALAKQLAPNEILLTAHHQDDQAETVLLQLLRGAGVKGLAGMPVKRKLGKGWLVRPLLSISREQIVAYAEQQCLNWIDDSSNYDQQFSRNYLRHHVMPLLKKRWPQAITTITRSAEHCADADQLMTEQAQADLVNCYGADNNRLCLSSLRQLSINRQYHVLRQWLYQHNVLLPSTQQLQQLQHDFLSASVDSQVLFTSEQYQLRRYRSELYFLPDQDLVTDKNTQWQASWHLHSPLVLPAKQGYLIANYQSSQRGITDKLDVNQITVCFRQGGERFHPHNRQHSQMLKKLLQEWQVPYWQRNRIPLIFYGDECIAVVGYSIAKSAMSLPGEKSWLPTQCPGFPTEDVGNNPPD